MPITINDCGKCGREPDLVVERLGPCFTGEEVWVSRLSCPKCKTKDQRWVNDAREINQLIRDWNKWNRLNGQLDQKSESRFRFNFVPLSQFLGKSDE